MNSGYVTIITTTANGRQPAAGCHVTITRPDAPFRYTTQTGVDGRTNHIALETVPKEVSMHYQTMQSPFIRYHVEIDCPGYLRATDYKVDIFDDTSCILQVNLIPASSQEDMPAASTQRGICGDELLPLSSDRRAYASDNPVMIPKMIRVKMGDPAKNGPILHVPFVHYVASVTSQLTYPTWPDEAISLIANAVVSNALYRIVSNTYSALGYNFDITNSVEFDQPFAIHHAIGVSISNICDEVFNEYVSKGYNLMPTRFVFSLHRKSKEDVLMMDPWHVLNLATQDKNALEIIQALYGPQYFLIECAAVEGVVQYPGSRLRIGDTGSAVTLMQRCCNTIAHQFPTIPLIRHTNGIFDQAMQETVIAVQTFLFHQETGMIDKKAWYALQKLQNEMIALHELMALARTITPDQLVFPGKLRLGDNKEAVSILQLMMNINALFLYALPVMPINARLDKTTKLAVQLFQTLFGLPADGIVDQVTWDTIAEVYQRNYAVIDHEETKHFPGSIDESSDQRTIATWQTYMNQIAQSRHWPRIQVNGVFDGATRDMLHRCQNEFALPHHDFVDHGCWDQVIQEYAMQASHHPWPGKVIKTGSAKELISFLQNKLQIVFSHQGRMKYPMNEGIFDETMQYMIGRIQWRTGLPVTGEVDRETWQAIIRLAAASTLNFEYV